MSRLRFEVTAAASGSQARAARFRTLHGEVLTPVFMPVGTHAAVRGVAVEDLEAPSGRTASPPRSRKCYHACPRHFCLKLLV